MNYQFEPNLVLLIFIILSLVGISFISAHLLKISSLTNLYINGFVQFCAIFRLRQESLARTDASYYYESGFSDLGINFGTDFVSYLSGILSNMFLLDFSSIFIIFSIFAVFAIQIFYALFLKFGGSRQHFILRVIATGLIVVPIGFWGAGLNKDGLAFFSIALLLFSMSNGRINVWQMSVAVVILFLVRPHIGLISIFSVFVGVIFARDIYNVHRLVIASIAVMALLFLTPIIFSYIGIDEISVDAVSSFTGGRNEIYADTNAYINIRDLSPPLRLLSYLVRPFPWESSSPLQLIASIINIAFIVAFLLMYFNRNRQRKLLDSQMQLSYLVFFIAGLLVLGLTTSNLGISNRQKWMIAVPLLLLLLYRSENLISISKQSVNSRRGER